MPADLAEPIPPLAAGEYLVRERFWKDDAMTVRTADDLILASPRYREAFLYCVSGRLMRPWQFNGWQPESLSWKESAYIHGGLSGYGPTVFKGPDALKFLEGISTNSFAKYPVGGMKHAVMCTEQGLVASHGVLQRMSEDEFRLFATGPWAIYMAAKSGLDVEVTNRSDYLFQVAGPRSLDILEKATGESLRDIGFLRFRNGAIAGKQVEIGRIGMAGTLAFEVHGPMAEAPEIYDAIYRAGQAFGIERLGWRTYFVNHIEGGFPQQIWTFLSAQEEDAGYRAFFKKANVPLNVDVLVSGSVDPADMRARYRSPLELNWKKEVRFDHDFVGRDAIEEESRRPKRRTVTLRWNPEDVTDIYASLLRPGEPYKYIDMPAAPHITGQQAHADHILKNGRRVGYASGTIYSYYYREFLSHGLVDVDQAAIGNDVVVQWGDFGGRIKDVRATVERFPYLDVARNETVDLAAIPAT